VCPAWSLVRAKLQMALINPTTPPPAERRLAVADGVAGMACFNDHDVQAWLERKVAEDIGDGRTEIGGSYDPIFVPKVDSHTSHLLFLLPCIYHYRDLTDPR
jgi:hypothetical protein